MAQWFVHPYKAFSIVSRVVVHTTFLYDLKSHTSMRTRGIPTQVDRQRLGNRVTMHVIVTMRFSKLSLWPPYPCCKCAPAPLNTFMLASDDY